MEKKRQRLSRFRSSVAALAESFSLHRAHTHTKNRMKNETFFFVRIQTFAFAKRQRQRKLQIRSSFHGFLLQPLITFGSSLFFFWIDDELKAEREKLRCYSSYSFFFFHFDIRVWTLLRTTFKGACILRTQKCELLWMHSGMCFCVCYFWGAEGLL